MPPLGWLLLAVVAAVAAYLVGWPAWQGPRARETRDANTERYLAWRGRGSEAPRGRSGPTADERRRLYAGAALGAVAVAALLAFFVTS
jgi:hypothetical protein